MLFRFGVLVADGDVIEHQTIDGGFQSMRYSFGEHGVRELWDLILGLRCILLGDRGLSNGI